ncbi:MAG: citrate synthase [Verrucomicrobia bacterium]|nr:citrate synthase [Verrucomicrobiota bacterium]
MSEKATLTYDGKTTELPVIIGSEKEHAVDIAKLRDQTGLITYDDGFRNTGSCTSDITFIDGEEGILRYRGYPIEELAEKSTFVEVAWLLIYGNLPTRTELRSFSDMFTEYQVLHEDMKYHFEGFPPNAHPMAILSSMINACGCFTRELTGPYDPSKFKRHTARLISQVRTIAAFAYRKSLGLPIVYPKPEYKYTANFLHMMFSMPYGDVDLEPEAVAALDQIFLLHADHEQNCSTSTVRMVASSRANIFASAAAGVCALWGPLHGGANQAVLDMLGQIRNSGDDGSKFLESVKSKEGGKRLMGFGHAVYKNYDPRAKIIKASCDKLLARLKQNDPLLDIALKLEETALKDPYFLERKLYPNVDFYSGIIMRALGIPTEMFTVMFAIGRMPGWIANFKEVMDDPKSRIYRPRQIYTGPTMRTYVPLDQR